MHLKKEASRLKFISIFFIHSRIKMQSEERDKLRKQAVTLIRSLLISSKGGVPIEKLNRKLFCLHKFQRNNNKYFQLATPLLYICLC